MELSLLLVIMILKILFMVQVTQDYTTYTMIYKNNDDLFVLGVIIWVNLA